MNNAIRKSISSVMAAVALSACVLTPTTFNVNDGKLNFVNTIEAEAAFNPYYGLLLQMSTSLKDAPNGRTIGTLSIYTPVYVIDSDYRWVKVRTSDGEGWIKDNSILTISAQEYYLRQDFIAGKRTAFVTARRGIDCREQPSMDSKVKGNIWFLGTAEVVSIWPASRGNIVWAQLANGTYLPLTNEKGGYNQVELLTKEEAARMKRMYSFSRYY